MRLARHHRVPSRSPAAVGSSQGRMRRDSSSFSAFFHEFFASFLESYLGQDAQRKIEPQASRRTVHLGCLKVKILRSNCMDSLVGIQLPYSITMVLPKGIFVKVPYGRARDHRVHHLRHHQHHLGRGPFWVSPICHPISSTVSIATNARPFSRNKE